MQKSFLLKWIKTCGNSVALKNKLWDQTYDLLITDLSVSN